MAMSRSVGPMSFTTLPSIATVPAEIVSSPAIIRSSVDLPQPDGPTSTTKLAVGDCDRDALHGLEAAA